MVNATYTRLNATAERLIAKYGRSAVLRRTVKTGPAHNPTLSSQDYDIIYVETGYSITNRSDAVIQTGDKVGLISTDADVEPHKDDKLVVDGQTWTFFDLQPLNPGGLLLLTEFVARR